MCLFNLIRPYGWLKGDGEQVNLVNLLPSTLNLRTFLIARQSNRHFEYSVEIYAQRKAEPIEVESDAKKAELSSIST